MSFPPLSSPMTHFDRFQIVISDFVSRGFPSQTCTLNVFTSICRNPPNDFEPDQLFRWRGLFVSMSARHHSGLFVRHPGGAGRPEVGGKSVQGQLWIAGASMEGQRRWNNLFMLVSNRPVSLFQSLSSLSASSQSSSWRGLF